MANKKTKKKHTRLKQTAEQGKDGQEGGQKQIAQEEDSPEEKVGKEGGEEARFKKS